MPLLNCICMTAWSDVGYSSGTCKYRVYCISNVSLAKQTEYLSPPTYFRQITVFIILEFLLFTWNNTVIIILSLITLQGSVYTYKVKRMILTHCSAFIAVVTCQIWWNFVDVFLSCSKKTFGLLFVDTGSGLEVIGMLVFYVCQCKPFIQAILKVIVMHCRMLVI